MARRAVAGHRSDARTRTALRDDARHGGVGFQYAGGLRGCIDRRPVYSEIKYSRGTPAVSITQGHADTVARTVHELAGMGFTRCR